MFRTRNKLDSRVESLRRLPRLRGLSEADLGRIAATLDQAELRPGAVLTREGRVAQDWYLIVDGEADVTIRGEFVGRLGPGEFVGEMALVSGGPRSATVRAVTSMRVLTGHKSVFTDLLGHAAVARIMLTRMTDRLRRAEGAPEAFTPLCSAEPWP
jgi:CRP-like cAMP-binding protein